MVKNYMATRKITIAGTWTAVAKDEQWSVIRFLMLENVSCSVTYTRMCVVYSVKNVITKSTTVNWWVQRFKARQTNMSDDEAVDYQKEGPNVVCHRHQQTHRLIWKMHH